MTNCPAPMHVYNICSLLTKQIAIYLPQIWLVISKKAKDAFGSAGDSQSINQSINLTAMQ